MKKYIAYYRVSTKDQNLGLDSQKDMVHSYLKSNNGELLHEYEEKETGTNKKQRIEINRAIEHCIKVDAILIIAKLDRLSRNVAFTASLMDSKVKFTALDIPNADNFTIHIIAAMAQREAELISSRTKAALAQLKKQGKKLGNPQNFTNDGRLKGTHNNTLRAKQNENNIKAMDKVKDNLEKILSGQLSYRNMAEKLNNTTHRTSTGKKFHATTVKRMVDKLKQVA